MYIDCIKISSFPSNTPIEQAFKTVGLGKEEILHKKSTVIIHFAHSSIRRKTIVSPLRVC